MTKLLKKNWNLSSLLSHKKILGVGCHPQTSSTSSKIKQDFRMSEHNLLGKFNGNRNIDDEFNK